MISPQHLYLALDFKFDNGESKPKFFVVFHVDEDEVLLSSLTTSQQRLPASVDLPTVGGCVQLIEPGIYEHAYIWPEQRIIGTNGYAPSKRAYVQLARRVHLVEKSLGDSHRIATERVVEKCRLTDAVFCDLLRCLIQSKYLKQKHRRAILVRIAELSQ